MLVTLIDASVGSYEWSEIYASDAGSSDYFGYAVGIWEDTVIVGAYGNGAGSAYIFIQDSESGNWTQRQKLLASDGDSGDRFGYSVSIYENVAIIGAMCDDDIDTNVGAAYIFTKDETTGNWSQTVKLLPNETDVDSNSIYCGHSVSISGNVAIMGCYQGKFAQFLVFVFYFICFFNVTFCHVILRFCFRFGFCLTYNS